MHTAKPPIVLFRCFRRLHRTGLRTWSMLRCWGLRALGRPVFPLLVVAGGAFRPACASGRPAGPFIPAALLARGPSLPGLLCVFALAARRASFPLRGTLPAFRPLAALLRRAEPLQKAGLLRADEERIALTDQGFLLSNSIIVALLG